MNQLKNISFWKTGFWIVIIGFITLAIELQIYQHDLTIASVNAHEMIATLHPEMKWLFDDLKRCNAEGAYPEILTKDGCGAHAINVAKQRALSDRQMYDIKNIIAEYNGALNAADINVPMHWPLSVLLFPLLGVLLFHNEQLHLVFSVGIALTGVLSLGMAFYAARKRKNHK